MPTQYQKDCPYCLARSAGFQVKFQWSSRKGSDRGYILGICGVCNNGVVTSLRNASGSALTSYAGGSYDFPHGNDRVVESYPSVEHSAPADCPPSVERFYIQGFTNLRGQNWDAAGAMFRKSLDVATKIISPDEKGKTLFVRINSLVDRGLLTSAIGDWSHELRIDGNEAVHDEEPETEEDAVAMQKFAEAILRYAFTLPSLVAQNRAKREDESSD